MQDYVIGAYKSPNKKYGFDFLFEGEIRFGPQYYRVRLNGKELKNRIFGFEFKWSNDSDYLALQEWLTTDYANGPDTALVIIDLDKKNVARISRAHGGFIVPLNFKDGKVIYQKKVLSRAQITEYEIELDKIENWTSLQTS
ncbi:MAG: hypothetical protein AAF944_17690 [Bacteroidota bacterium]